MRSLIIAILLFVTTMVVAQPYGNEWVDFSKNYYKIPTWTNRVYRVTQPSLFAVGLPTTTLGSELRLYKNGVQIPILVSTNGTFGVNDYIEFMGARADGILDKELFSNPNNIPNPNISLISDTCFYFLTTYNNGNLRFNAVANTISSPPAAELYCWDVIDSNYRNLYCAGTDYDPNLGDNFESSRFDPGEGYIRALINNSADSVKYNLANAYKSAGAPMVQVNGTILGYSNLLAHNAKMAINAQFLDTVIFPNYGHAAVSGLYDVNKLNAANDLWYRVSSYNGFGDDKIGMMNTIIKYPRQFAFNGAAYKYFEMDAKPAVHYVEITNFNTGGLAPLLLDITNNKQYIGDIIVPGKIRFQLPATTSVTKYYLISQSATARIVTNSVEPLNFVDYNAPGQQKNYVIFYSKDMAGLSTSNALNNYKAYRESAVGGNYKVSLIPVEQLYNQFGFGYNFHAAGLRRFLKFAQQNWTIDTLKTIFIIGKGLEFDRYNPHYTIGGKNYKGIVPTFGHPGSDNLLVDLNYDVVQDFNIGRLSAYNTAEVELYLNKVKEYDLLENATKNSIIDSAIWKKKVLHIGGGDDASLQAQITSAFNKQKNIIEGEIYGGIVKTTLKNSTDLITSLNTDEVNNYINSGTGIIQYYGHSASTTFAFALKDANDYTNGDGKYPIFIANGCDANNYFLDAPQRSLTENFVFAPKSGSIVFIGSSNNGYTGYIDKFTDFLYTIWSIDSTSKFTIGEQMKLLNKRIVGTGVTGGLWQGHAEQIQLHGDPAVNPYIFTKPDYAIEEKFLTISPNVINTALDSFTLKLKVFNLGKFVKDTITLSIKHTTTAGIDTTYYKKYTSGIAFVESFEITLLIDKIKSSGINTFDFKIDANNKVDELFETNNTFTKQINIYKDNAVPLYPLDFGILHHAPNLQLVAQTLDPFAVNKTYVFQIDTTELYNSPIKQVGKVTSVGGVLRWQHTLPMWDSTVYYWRVSIDSTSPTKGFEWSYRSFVYLTNGSDGWNQSHYYQYLNNGFNKLNLNTNRTFSFTPKVAKYKIYNAKQQSDPPFNFSTFDFKAEADGDLLYTSGCAYNVMHIMVIDSLTGKPIRNRLLSPPNVGMFGSRYCSRNGFNGFFEFNCATAAQRKVIMDFMDSVKVGNYLIIRPHIGTAQIHARHYAADTATLGVGVSLYHKLKDVGFTTIDSFNKNKPWVFFYRKGFATTAQTYMAKDSTELISPVFDIPFIEKSGYMQSVQIGPAASWQQLLYNGYSLDTKNGDSTIIGIYGLDTLGAKTFIVNVIAKDTNLSFIDAALYPKLQLQYNTFDTVSHTAQQVDFWRILYKPFADAVLAPNLGYYFKLNYQEGEQMPLKFSVYNASTQLLDSNNVIVYIQDKNQNKVKLANLPLKTMQPFDSVTFNTTIDNLGLIGNNTLYININPTKKPHEMQYANNIGYQFFDVKGDIKNPLIDVTFDGIHILKDDIVSATPFIQIKLKDENKFLRLNDTSLFEVYLTKPSTQNKIKLNFNDTMQFVPADNDVSKENAAYINYKPNFKDEDGIYEIEVKAKDKSGNNSGAFAYKNSFQVINRQMVSTMLNYPNPFSTSTQFVFTLTGNEVPDNMKIQIMNISGSMVREITKAELGPLHIGRNITSYKWDGTDQMGDKLANGVYFYRFVVKNNGVDVINRSNADIDKYITKEMGKLIIIR